MKLLGVGVGAEDLVRGARELGDEFLDGLASHAVRLFRCRTERDPECRGFGAERVDALRDARRVYTGLERVEEAR